MKRRVVVTGFGAVTSLGSKVEELWARILRGESGISLLRRLNVSNYRVRFGGEIYDWSVDGYIEAKDVKRFDRFVQFAQVSGVITVEAMVALVAWASGDAAAADAVRECEHRADLANRELWQILRDAFSPPLDAEDLYSLSADLDEVLNAAKDLVREMEVMAMEPDPPTREMATLLAGAVGHLADAFGCLGAEGDATQHADAAIKSQRKVEHAYRTAMSALLEVPDLREVSGRREVYRRLSRIGDLIHTVAERVWYSVVKEA